MSRHTKSYNVIGGRIRVTCPRCNAKKYAEVAPGTRRKVVRCNCGMSACYTVNYRRASRESASGKAHIILNNAREAMIRLCDSSYAGIGFIIPPEFALSLSCGQEIRVKYRAGSGSIAQRKVRIRNISGTRVGGQYA